MFNKYINILDKYIFEVNLYLRKTKIPVYWHMSRHPYRWQNTNARGPYLYLYFIYLRKQPTVFRLRVDDFTDWLSKEHSYVFDKKTFTTNLMAALYIILQWYWITEFDHVFINFKLGSVLTTKLTINYTFTIVILLILFSLVRLLYSRKITGLFINSCLFIITLLIICEVSGSEHLGYFMFLNEMSALFIVFIVSQNKKNINNNNYIYTKVLFILIIVPTYTIYQNNELNFNFYSIIYQNSYSDFINLMYTLYVVNIYTIYLCFIIYIFSILCILNFSNKITENYINNIKLAAHRKSLINSLLEKTIRFKSNFNSQINYFINKWN